MKVFDYTKHIEKNIKRQHNCVKAESPFIHVDDTKKAVSVPPGNKIMTFSLVLKSLKAGVPPPKPDLSNSFSQRVT